MINWRNKNMIKVDKKKITLAASVSCMDFCNLGAHIAAVEDSSVGFFHFDVVDGRFNNCIILGLPILESMRERTKLPIEVHLAVYEPEKYIEQFVKAGADYIAVHYEAMDNPRYVFELIQKYGAVPVLAYKATTCVDKNFADLISFVPWVLKLTVNPGFSGQKIQPASFEHIKSMREQINESGLDVGIQADGNININTIESVVSAGADMLTGGTSGLFLKGKTVAQNAEAMLISAYSALGKSKDS